jgi:hypothetical protein
MNPASECPTSSVAVCAFVPFLMHAVAARRFNIGMQACTGSAQTGSPT